MEYDKALEEVALAHRDLTCLNWDQLPNISLYMDQVIGYTEQTLSALQRSAGEKLLTKAMINNYSKDGLIHPPQRKRYSREHLALIFMIYFLKQTLSIPDVRSLLDAAPDTDMERRYEGFNSALRTAMDDMDGRVEALAEDVAGLPEAQARALIHDEAVRLAMEAYARKRMVERLIDIMQSPKGEAAAKADGASPRQEGP